MIKYLIIKASKCDRDHILGRLKYCQESILGSIIAKSRAVALVKAIELTGYPSPIIAIYSSLLHSELELAKSAPILWEQPEGNPVTEVNPRGAGKVSGYDETISVSIRLGLTSRGADWYRSQPNKSRTLSKLIEAESKQSEILKASQHLEQADYSALAQGAVNPIKTTPQTLVDRSNTPPKLGCQPVIIST